MLTRVHVEGFKCLREVSVDLGPFNVLIGRNDSGKSSFLQAVSEPTRALARGVRVDTAAVSTGDWRVRLTTSDAELVYQSSRPDLPTFQQGPGSPAGVGFPDAHWGARWFGEHPEFAATDPVSLDPAVIPWPSQIQLASLDQFVATRGQGTAAHLATLALGNRKRFEAIESALRDVTNARVQDIVVTDIGSSTYRLAFRLADGSLVAAEQMSQGVLLYLAFLALVERDPMPGVLLIEEPERGLHPMRLFSLIEVLRTLAFRGVQVILTTHSPDLLSACKPSEVRIFHRPEPGSPTEVHALPADFERRTMREPLGQVWAARGEEGLLDLVRERLVPVVHADVAE